MITISLCMIVKNEEAVLGRCLDSVRGIADEIIIVDTGSSDATVVTAEKYTDRIFHYEWDDNFSKARNFSFSQASMQYILWLDADDVLKNPQDFLTLKETLPQDTDAVMLPYHAAFDDAGNPVFTYYRERLARRESGFLWHEPVHEYLGVSGKILTLDAAVHHMPGRRAQGHSTRNLDIYRERLKHGEVLSTRGLFYFARELKTHGYTAEAVEGYTKALSRPDLWLEDAITASGDLADCRETLGELDKALEALFASFVRDLPRAEILCKIGSLYVRIRDENKAIFWYKLALQCEKPGGWGFVTPDCRDFIPHMQLCMLYDRAGDRESALRHHEAAKRLRPGHASVAYNERYFSGGG